MPPAWPNCTGRASELVLIVNETGYLPASCMAAATYSSNWQIRMSLSDARGAVGVRRPVRPLDFVSQLPNRVLGRLPPMGRASGCQWCCFHRRPQERRYGSMHAPWRG
jgi:hypothetical protein